MFGAAYHPLPSEEGRGAALGNSPELWQVSESLVRVGREYLRISRLFSLHVKDGGSCALVLRRKPLFYLRKCDINKKVFIVLKCDNIAVFSFG